MSPPREGDDRVRCFFEYIPAVLWRLFRRVGIFWLNFWTLAARPVLNFYQNRLKPLLRRLDFILLRFRKWASKRRQGILFRFYHFLKFYADAWHVVRQGYCSAPSAHFPLRLWNALAAFGRGICNNGRWLLRALNYLFPAAAVAVFLFLIQYVSGLNYAVSVEYNGQLIGYIQDESVYTDAETRLQSRLIYQEGDSHLYSTPKFSVTVVEKDELQTGPELTDILIRSATADIVHATGITVDGEFLGAVKDGSALRDTLDGILSTHRDSSDERVEFTKNIQLEPGLFLQNNLRDTAEVISVLTSNVQQNVYYTATSGDTPSGIAALYDMSISDLAALNPNILTDLKVGQQVLVNKAEAYLPVKEIRKVSYTEPISYETIYVDNANLYEGTTQTISAGKEGVMNVTAEIAYVDGVEVERSVLSRSVSSQPIAAKVAKGTMKMKVVSGYENARKSDYGLIWPVSGGYISQYYGHTPYEYWHTGIDYAGTGYGAPIVSVLPGTVTYAGWRGSYGNLVVVNHGNGMETWYAHCSSILVHTGETVAQGQKIARVGSTGNSSGNHLHFRVVINGAEKNPLDYLP